MFNLIQWMAPLYLAGIGRLHGSTFPTPKVLEGALFALPYVYFTYVATSHYNSISSLQTVAILLFVLIWTTVFKNTAHADGFKDYVRDAPLSKLAVPISEWFDIPRNSQRYDAIFWAVKGLFISLPTSVLTANLSLVFSHVIGYPLAYWLGYRQKKVSANIVGETLSGFIFGLAFFLQKN